MKKFAELDNDFKEYLFVLQASGSLREKSGTVSEGIVETLLNHGLEGLSSKQVKVFYEHVLSKFFIEKCAICNEDIQWPQMFEAYKNKNMCEICVKTRQAVKNANASK